jgi:hypothetical protein
VIWFHRFRHEEMSVFPLNIKNDLAGLLRLAHTDVLRYARNVKTLTVGEAQGQLAELIAEAHRGAVIVLTDGEKQVWLDTQKPLDLETDNPELKAELLKGIDGPLTAYSSQEMRSIGKRILSGRF